MNRLSSDNKRFSFKVNSEPVRSVSSDCVNVLARSNTESFPYIRDWKLGFDSDLSPKVSPNLISNFFFCFY